MQAIIDRYTDASGPKICVMGHGQDEAEARQCAFKATHHGHNPYDQAWEGGECVMIAPDLEALFNAAQDVYTYDGEGRIVSIGATDENIKLINALGKPLLDEHGRLSYRK